MSLGFEILTRDALITEQALVQADKFQGRLLDEYSQYMFPGQTWREPRGSAVTDFVKPFLGDTEASFEAVLRAIGETKQGQPVNWADMGGGRALPMRQLASKSDVKPLLQMTNVDLFNFGLEGLDEDEIGYLEDLSPGMTAPESEPLLVIDNIEAVKLSEPQDIITSVEVMQYLNNPLTALSNWYNQLADNGMMIVAAEHDWSSWIRYQRQPARPDREETPTKHLLEELTRAGINHAVTYESDWQSGVRPDVDSNRFRIMAIQKKPGTELKVTQPVVEVWVNPYDFKAAYYEVPTAEASPIVEVVNTDKRVTLKHHLMLQYM